VSINLLAVLLSMTAVAQPVAQEATKAPTFKPEELEQIVAPIALYPDSVLAQVFMASTYPLEIVQAARWSKEHPDVKGDALQKEMQKQSWDASVKSLTYFPDVLAMMNEKLDWTQKLGDAFLAQQKDVMDAVQRLRAKAKAEGNLESSKEQTVRTEPAPAGASTTTIIYVEPADPQVVYVPTYNPVVVYGAWPYPAYPPYYYYPPGYVAATSFFSFTFGVAVGGALWGNCNWGHSDVDIDINRQNNFNNINTGDRGTGNRGNQKWEHNSEHRKGAQYRDSATQQKYGKASDRQAQQSREQYRGRADEGRQQMAREGTGSQRDLSASRSDRSPAIEPAAWTVAIGAERRAARHHRAHRAHSAVSAAAPARVPAAAAACRVARRVVCPVRAAGGVAEMTSGDSAMRIHTLLLLGAAVILAAGCGDSFIRQKSYASAEEASQALISAVRDGKIRAMLQVRRRGDLSSSRATRCRTRTCAQNFCRHTMPRIHCAGSRGTCHPAGWGVTSRFVSDHRGRRMRFDSSEGAEEVVNRRVGENEAHHPGLPGIRGRRARVLLP
jgi:hypothetical protein